LTAIAVQKDLVRRAKIHKKVSKPRAEDKAVLIVNPSSCSGLTGKGWDDLFPRIKAVLGGNPKVVFTRKGGDGSVLARQFLRKRFTEIIALGGDGTLNEVANGFFDNHSGVRRRKYDDASFPTPSKLRPLNPRAIMAVVPCGTRNVLSKSLGLPEGVVDCCRAFSLGKPRKIDLITATVTNPDTGSSTSTRVVLNAAEIGLGAEIIDRSRKVRKAVNSRIVSTIAGIISTVPTYQSNQCEVSLNGGQKRFTANMTMAVIANGGFLGGGFRAAPRADMSDGLLDLVILKDSGSFKMLDELVNMKDGDYSEEDKVFYRQVKKVSLASKERAVTVTIDGEPIGILPATFEVMPGALAIRM
jgi:diacylglycerol kinase family enzyme